MLMPGRTFAQEDYLYGFNGMEGDDELKGNGNSYTTLFRQYDPRVARWLSVDPKAPKYPDISPYVSFLNNPVFFTDPYGDDPPENTDELLSYLANYEGDGLSRDESSGELYSWFNGEAHVYKDWQSFFNYNGYYITDLDGEDVTLPEQTYVRNPMIMVQGGKAISHEQALSVGKNVAHALLVAQTTEIITGRDLDTNKELTSGDYVLKAGNILLNIVPIGRFIPRNVDDIIVGAIKSGGGRGTSLTQTQATRMAESLGLMEISKGNLPKAVVNAVGKKKAKVFFDPESGRYFTHDLDGHIAEYGWKIFDKSGNRATAVFDGEMFIKVGD